MRKGIAIGILVLVVGLLAGWWIWIRSAHGFSANAKPTWIEARIASISRWFALPQGQSELKNPYPATPARLAAAQSLYKKQCASCHADNGDGQTTLGQSMYPKVTDLRRIEKPDGALYYSIRNGIRLSGMPAWSQYSDQQLWGLVSLIDTMREGRAGAQGAPGPAERQAGGVAKPGSPARLRAGVERQAPRQSMRKNQ